MRLLPPSLLVSFALSTSLSMVATGARAQESLDDIAGATPSTPGAANAGKRVEANGYIDNRFTYTHVAPLSPNLVPTSDTPSLTDLLEVNGQLKVNLGTKAFVYGDVSLFFQVGGLYYDRDAVSGNVIEVDNHDVAALHPFVSTSELYLSVSPTPWLNFLVGRKRIVWGSGFAFNPTDLINPPKDPTDPNLQRAGAWVARVELPFKTFTFSALFAPSVLYQYNGLPDQMLIYPGYDTTNNQHDTPHYLVAARAYALLFDADINLIYYFSNQFQDGFNNKSRVGMSFSRYFLTDYELHVEALFQSGSSRDFADHDCVNGLACPNISAAYAASKLDSSYIYPRVLVGGRTTFRDESTLSIEYYYQADGYSNQEFGDLIRGLVLAQKLGANLLTGGLNSDTTTAAANAGALPQRFSFDPLRRHYLIGSFTKPKIGDDWAVTLITIIGLTDLSMLLSPSVSWTPKEWLSLSLYAYVPVRGIPVGQVTVGGVAYNEYSLLPFDFRGMFEARAFY